MDKEKTLGKKKVLKGKKGKKIKDMDMEDVTGAHDVSVVPFKVNVGEDDAAEEPDNKKPGKKKLMKKKVADEGMAATGASGGSGENKPADVFADADK